MVDKRMIDRHFRCTKKLIESVKNATNTCFKQAEHETKQKWKKEDKKYEDLDSWFSSSQYTAEFQEELDALYRKKVCFLHTRILGVSSSVMRRVSSGEQK